MHNVALACGVMGPPTAAVRTQVSNPLAHLAAAAVIHHSHRCTAASNCPYTAHASAATH
jgi:hypothetical protein